MRTNRKRRCNSTGPTHTYILFPAVLIVLAIAIGFGVKLSIDSKCSVLGKSIRALETELIALRTSYAKEQNAWANATRPENLELALSKHGIYMEGNQSDKHIVSLNGSPTTKPTQRAGTAYAKNK